MGGVNAGGALLQVFGGGAAGFGGSMKENALIKLKQEALSLRDTHIANLRNRNYARDYKREQKGLLEQREYDQPINKYGRNVEALMKSGLSEKDAQQKARDMMTGVKDRDPTKLLKIRGDLISDYLKMTVPEFTEPTEAELKAAHKYADDIIGGKSPATKPKPEGSHLDSILEKINEEPERQKKEKDKVTRHDKGKAAEGKGKRFFEGTTPEDTEFTGIAKKVKDLLESGPKRFEAGGKLEYRNKYDQTAFRYDAPVAEKPKPLLQPEAIAESDFPPDPEKKQGEVVRRKMPERPPEEKKEFSPFAPSSAIASPAEEPPIEKPQEGLLEKSDDDKDRTWEATIEKDVKLAGHKKHGMVIKLGNGPWKKVTTTQYSDLIEWAKANPEKAKKIPGLTAKISK